MRVTRVSLPVRGAWIEIFIIRIASKNRLSLPVRGAWIEMLSGACRFTSHNRRSPCGERGLKCRIAELEADTQSRSPCGERGLKYQSVRLL